MRRGLLPLVALAVVSPLVAVIAYGAFLGEPQPVTGGPPPDCIRAWNSPDNPHGKLLVLESGYPVSNVGVASGYGVGAGNYCEFVFHDDLSYRVFNAPILETRISSDISLGRANGIDNEGSWEIPADYDLAYNAVVKDDGSLATAAERLLIPSGRPLEAVVAAAAEHRTGLRSIGAYCLAKELDEIGARACLVAHPQGDCRVWVVEGSAEKLTRLRALRLPRSERRAMEELCRPLQLNLRSSPE